jgi:hypothetical protein
MSSGKWQASVSFAGSIHSKNCDIMLLLDMSNTGWEKGLRSFLKSQGMRPFGLEAVEAVCARFPLGDLINLPKMGEFLHVLEVWSGRPVSLADVIEISAVTSSEEGIASQENSCDASDFAAASRDWLRPQLEILAARKPGPTD